MFNWGLMQPKRKPQVCLIYICIYFNQVPNEVCYKVHQISTKKIRFLTKNLQALAHCKRLMNDMIKIYNNNDKNLKKCHEYTTTIFLVW